MKLIVGLGNPDKEYLNTFHNLGFMSVDKLANALNIEFNKQKCKAMIAETKINGEKVILAKPLTYMNLSGESIRELLSFYKIELENLIVIYDDYDLEKGAIRIRKEGSAGTHNGMRNIVKELSSTNFKRVRIGFKQDGEVKIPLINYVLSGIKKEEKDLFEKATERASKVAHEFILGVDFDKIMQKYNGKID
ncbi:MAG: aminoacyl-tRNA hydrolase [Clostridia bacterium]|nr:aminoacyl-tRNA hydrolase [Clostridia bacterium]